MRLLSDIRLFFRFEKYFNILRVGLELELRSFVLDSNFCTQQKPRKHSNGLFFLPMAMFVFDIRLRQVLQHTISSKEKKLLIR